VVLFNQARHPHGLYSARQRSRLFDRENPQLRRSPTPTGFAEIAGDDFPILPRAADSRLLILAEFLESGIAAQRVPDWVEP
jgi:hypothetical protein